MVSKFACGSRTLEVEVNLIRLLKKLHLVFSQLATWAFDHTTRLYYNDSAEHGL